MSWGWVGSNRAIFGCFAGGVLSFLLKDYYLYGWHLSIYRTIEVYGFIENVSFGSGEHA